MKSLLVAALFFANGLMLSAHADSSPTAVTDNQLIGRWISTVPVFSGNGMTVYLGLEFNAVNGAMSSICQFPGKTLEARVEVPINAGAGAIDVLGAGRNEVRDGSYTCNVEIQVGKVNYSMVGANLRLNANGNALDFKRR